MAYPIERKLVIAVASSAVFDMRRAHEVFVTAGEDAYRKYQIDRLDKPFQRGVAFPFIRRLLNLNKIYAKEQPIEVVVLSKNDPETGLRFFRSCRHYDLPITRGSFLAGKSPHPYMPAFNASLFLSPAKEDVMEASSEGFPAGLVLPADIEDDAEDMQLRVAFDFDGVLCDDESENVYQTTQNLDLFHEFEEGKSAEPHGAGPLKDLLEKMAYFQRLERKKAKKDKSYKPALRIAIVTARNAPANERFVTTLKKWGISADETFFLGGIEKRRVIDILKPHIFFDDQITHLRPSAKTIPSVHIPFGDLNHPGKPAPGEARPKGRKKKTRQKMTDGEGLPLDLAAPGQSAPSPGKGFVDISSQAPGPRGKKTLPRRRSRVQRGQ